MPAYRLFFFEAGHIVRREELEADSDQAALEAARGHRYADHVEVWHGAIRVGIVKPGE